MRESAALWKSEEEYQAFFSTSRDGVFMASLDGYFIELNDEAVEIFGYESRAELLKVRIDKLYADAKERKRHIREILEWESLKNYPVDLLKKDGTIINTLISTVIQKDRTGSFIGYQGTIRDITAEKQRIDALLENEVNYRLLVEYSFDLIWSMTAEGVFTYVSPSWERITGYIPSFLVGKSYQLLVHPDYADAFFKYLQSVIQSKKAMPNPEYLIKHADNTWHWHGINVLPVVGEDGEFVSFVGISRDITKRKLSEETLLRERQRLAGVIEGIAAGTWEWNVQTGTVIFNQRWADMLGYTLEELAPTGISTWIEMRHPDDIKRTEEQLAAHFRGELDLYDCEMRKRHKNGTWGWVQNRGRVITRSDDGKPLMMFGTQIDITKRKQAEEFQKESQRQLEQIIEFLPDPTFMINAQGQVVFWNKAIEEMTGIPKEQMIGKGNYEHAIPFYGKRCPILIDNVLLSNNKHNESTKKYHFINEQNATLLGEIYIDSMYDGKGGYLSGSAARLCDLHGNTIGAIESLRDITDRNQTEIALALEKQNLHITLESIGDGVISTDCQGKIELLNKVAEQLTGWKQNEADNKPLAEVFKIYNEFTKRRAENPALKVLNTGDIIELTNTVLVSKEGIGISCEGSASPIKDKDNNVKGVVLVFRDITEKKERQAEINFLSYRDPLTGLYNRRFYEEELKRLDAERNLPLTLIMADVNGLKLVNDAFGHLKGDQLLKRAAEIMKKECRADDIIARIGGDEFILLLPKTNSMQAEAIVKRIKEAIAIEQSDGNILSISFGWQTKTKVTEEISNVYKEAENLMYRHKLSESASIRSKTVQAMIKTLFEKNEREQQHSTRTSFLCQTIGEALGLGVDDIGELRIVGLMHDIGKITLDDRILDKPDRLSDSEWQEIKQHPETGYRILNSINEFSQLANYVLAHHERWDGKGYPKGLKGKEIPLKARIIAVADAYDAMTSDRPYRKALSKDTALMEIKRNAGTQFDPKIVRAFIEKVLL